MTISRRNFTLLAVGSAATLLAQQTPLKRVDAKYVCFVTKHSFDKEQIPVSVDGKTYYGCCDMCKAKLKHDAAQRCDVDPVSKKQVDKATAVIAADSKGNVFFFENEDNLKKYNSH